MSLMDILARYGVPVNNLTKVSKGYKLSAPHRPDKNPSFSIFKIDPSAPDDEINSWWVKDFAQGLSMSLGKYLEQYFNANIPRKKAGKRNDNVQFKPPDLLKRVKHSYDFHSKPLESVDLPNISQVPYTGHGLSRAGIDSRDYNVYMNNGKPTIVYKDAQRVTGVKVRNGGKAKYSWLVGNGKYFWARKNGGKALIVVEGELKSIMFAHLFPEYDVVGIPSRSLLHVAPIWEYNRILWVFDYDVGMDYRSNASGVQKLIDTILLAFLVGKTIKLLDWGQLSLALAMDHGINQTTAWKWDINDWVENTDITLEDLKKFIIRHSKMVYFPRQKLLENMPTFDLPANATQLAALLYVKALSGQGVYWRNTTTVDVQVSLTEVMEFTGMGASTYYRSAAELKKLGIVNFKNGKLSQGSKTLRTYRLYISRLLKRVKTKEDPPPPEDHSSGSGYSSISVFPLLDHPITVDISKHFDHRYRYKADYKQLKLSHVMALGVQGQYGFSKRFTARFFGVNRQTLYRVLNRLVPETLRRIRWVAKVRRMLRLQRYYLLLSKILWWLDRAMPGTYVMGRYVFNKKWGKVVLHINDLLTGALVFGWWCATIATWDRQK